MNLKEINPRPNAKRLNRFYESRFGFTIDFNSLTVPKAKRIFRQLEENLNRIKARHGIYYSETNPKYTELLSIKEGLALWIRQNNILTEESQTAKAEVSMAAKSIVDEINDMVAKISKIQNEELIALVGAARDNIGEEQASEFDKAANASITAILDTLKNQASTLDQAVRRLAGDEVSMGPMDQGGDLSAAGSSEMPEPSDEPTFQATSAATGGTAPLGRERR